MIAAETVVLVLLAAGTSSRFGPRDKLAVRVDGLALGLHAARTLGSLPFAAKIAVVRAGGPDFAHHGFGIVINPDPGAGQSGSIRLGVARARLSQPHAVLIALADMPFVTAAHVVALMAAFDGPDAIIASTQGDRASPPALFGMALFPLLEELTGDAGARTMLRRARLVTAPAAELADIDTPDDLPGAERLGAQ